MNQGVLFERLKELDGLPEAGEAFDPTDDSHVDRAARSLLERFRCDNDTEAFTLLFELTHPKLGQIAGRITRRLSPQTDPEELAASFMTRLFTDVRERGRTPVRHFLGLAHSAMRNEVLDHLRRNKRTQVFVRRYQDVLPPPVDPSHEAASSEEDALLETYGQQLVDLTDECFHDLEAREKRVLVAREVLGLSYDRVATLLDLNANQIGMVIRRARQHLADRIVARLDQLPSSDSRERIHEIVTTCLESKERVKNVRGLVQQMLDGALRAGRRQLADLLYEMAKACLLEVPQFAERTLVNASPRKRALVADDLAHLAQRLDRAGDHDAPELSSVPNDERSNRLDAAEACLHKLEEVEGDSGRQQVALALRRIYGQQLPEAETLLRGLVERDLPEVTRQNVFRNLTLCLLRQERWTDALDVCTQSADEWPDDPVRLMNVCFGTARLGDVSGFEAALVQLAEVHERDPQLRVAAWIDGECRALAHDLALPTGRVDALLRDALGGTNGEAAS
ncbi:MAG: hypothetical protein DHS20C15_20310 [Planctomycetota bacterium]|nr:MAG: hypothetical protein DHS20C15_20310 [Planctomycetota bacterium]